MQTLKNRLITIEDLIRNTEKQFNRPRQSVSLLAVSKTWPASLLRQLAEAGQQRFGENYLQEALTKIKQCADLDLEWHFIGPIQSNKTRDIALHFDWVHTVDRLKIAQRLSNQRPDDLAPLNICIQVNIDDEATKSGIAANALLPLAAEIAQLPHLNLRGLMIIPAKTDNVDQQQASFHKAHVLFEHLSSIYPGIDTLSMGMSGDMTLAIAEGSTMVRVGSALFGQRATTRHEGNVN
ncbi:MAG: YggS family pyridoxal phosphate-dependent enzyme [Gammaproteobacteria bacterium]|nr:YggS family pyridoxal phosphate-dependent enzyme [Gammaproteobacteria bacterium]